MYDEQAGEREDGKWIREEALYDHQYILKTQIGDSKITPANNF